MRDELRVVNALVGMSVGTPGWPNTLQQFGYQLRAVEREVALRVDGSTRTIRPEAIFVSSQLNASLAVEAKSATLNRRQYGGYAALDGFALDTLGILQGCELSTHVVDAAYFSPGYHSEELRGQMVELSRELAADLALVSFDNHEFRLATGAFNVSELDASFRRGVAFDESRWPQSYMPFGPDSPHGEFVNPLTMTLAQLLLSDDVEAFNSRDICGGHPGISSRGIVPHYEFVGTDLRKRYHNVVADLIEEIRIHYLAAYFVRTGPHEWTKVKSLSGKGISRVNAELNDYATLKQMGLQIPPSRVSTDVDGQIIAGTGLE